MNPSAKLPLLSLCLLFFLNACIRKTFYQSPLSGAVAPYHAMPVASDSLSSASYANAAIALGGMNQNLHDNVFSFQGGLHRAHLIDNFRLSYGASVALGTYDVKMYDSYTIADTSAINRRAGTKFFGAYGGYAAISAAAPMGRRGEWRYLGLEGNLFNEFGSYYDFRKNLPDSAVTTVDKKRYMGSLGLSTEFIFKRKSGNKFGMKFMLGSYLRTLAYYGSSPYNRYAHDHLIFFAGTYHATIKRSTGFVQLNVATHATNFQFGFNYRL